MHYWFDTEFIEDGKTIDLLSVGIVAEDGREFYAENFDANFSKASDWVKDNVIVHLWSQQQDKSSANAWFRNGGAGGLLSHSDIRAEVLRFCNPESFGKPKFWAYYADYDWVVFCQLFGTMMNLPKGFPMYCRDIKQECDRLGNPKLPEQGKGEHHALADAKWSYQAWKFLQKLQNGYRVYRDGDQWCAVAENFTNLAESVSGFGNTPREAVQRLIVGT
jgi:3' exoribonuclease, RNase T-like